MAFSAVDVVSRPVQTAAPPGVWLENSTVVPSWLSAETAQGWLMWQGCRNLHLKLTQSVNKNIQQITARSSPPLILHIYIIFSVQPHHSTRLSDVVTLSRPPSSSSLKVNNHSVRHASPCLWNQLPKELCLPTDHEDLTDVSSSFSLSPPITPLFHSRLKIHLFHNSKYCLQGSYRSSKTKFPDFPRLFQSITQHFPWPISAQISVRKLHHKNTITCNTSTNYALKHILMHI